MIGFIYLWINKINGKKYVGLHVGDEDDGYVGSGVVFKKAVKKYGIDCFERVVLHREYISEESLYQKEFDIINELNAVFSLEFYNLSNYDPKYVNFVVGKKERFPMSSKSKEKIREAATGRVASDETKRKMSKTRKGRPSPTKGMKGLTSGAKNGQFGKKWYNDGESEGTFKPGSEPDGWILGRIKGKMTGKNNPFYGMSHSEETKRNLSEKMLGRFSGENNPFYGRKHTEETRGKMSASKKHNKQRLEQ